MRVKYRSESDLFPALEHQTGRASVRAETGENDSETASDLIHETGGGEVCDSDLFFDFDIGSPEPEPEVDIVLDHVINNSDDGMLVPDLGQVSHGVNFSNLTNNLSISDKIESSLRIKKS